MAVSLVSTGITFPDATTQTTAASAGGTRTFTTSGAVSAAGLPVALNSDGTVSTVANVAGANGGGSIAGYNVREYSTTQTIVFNSATNTYVATFFNSTGSTLNIVAGTLSGTTITWGTVLNAGSGIDSSYLGLDEASGNYLFVYEDGNVLYAKVLTVSGTTCTLQARVTVNSTLNTQYIIGTYDNVSGKHVVAAQDAGTSYAMFAFVGTVSGTTSTWVDKDYIFGTEPTQSGSTGNNTYGVTTDRLGTIVFWSRGNSAFVSSSNVMIQVGTISGTTLTLGTTAQMTATSTVNAAVISYNPAYAVWTLMILISTNLSSALITTSATLRTWSAVSGVTSGSTAFTGQLSGYTALNTQGISLGYDLTANKVVLLFQRSTQVFYSVPGQIVANALGTKTLTFEPIGSWGTVFSGATTYASTTCITYSSTAGKMIYIVGLAGSGLGYAVSTTPYSTNTNFIGVSTASAASGASLSCTIIGGVNTGVTGLTTNRNYYASTTGTLTTSPSNSVLVGRSLSATALLVTQANIS